MADEETIDYDMDSEDEECLNNMRRDKEITPLQFETIMDKLEKSSDHKVFHFCLCFYFFFHNIDIRSSKFITAYAISVLFLNVKFSVICSPYLVVLRVNPHGIDS